MLMFLAPRLLCLDLCLHLDVQKLGIWGLRLTNRPGIVV